MEKSKIMARMNGTPLDFMALLSDEDLLVYWNAKEAKLSIKEPLE